MGCPNICTVSICRFFNTVLAFTVSPKYTHKNTVIAINTQHVSLQSHVNTQCLQEILQLFRCYSAGSKKVILSNWTHCGSGNHSDGHIFDCIYVLKDLHLKAQGLLDSILISNRSVTVRSVYLSNTKNTVNHLSQTCPQVCHVVT